MKIAKITSVDATKTGTPIAKTASGLGIFGKKDTKFVVGEYILYNEQQSPVLDDDKQPTGEFKVVFFAASTWATKEEAMAAKNEDRLLAAEEDAFVARETAKVSAKYDVKSMLTDTVG